MLSFWTSLQFRHYFDKEPKLCTVWLRGLVNMYTGMKIGHFILQCRKYRRKMTEVQKYRMREKATASDLFKGKKVIYPERYCTFDLSLF